MRSSSVTSSSAYGAFHHGPGSFFDGRGTYTRAEQAFRYFDRHDRGFLDYRQLRQALRHCERGPQPQSVSLTRPRAPAAI